MDDYGNECKETGAWQARAEQAEADLEECRGRLLEAQEIQSAEWKHWEQRAEQAEAALATVRETARRGVDLAQHLAARKTALTRLDAACPMVQP